VGPGEHAEPSPGMAEVASDAVAVLLEDALARRAARDEYEAGP